MDGGSPMFVVALVGVAVRVLFYALRSSRSVAAPQPPLLLPPSAPRSQLSRPARPMVHHGLATAQEGEYITLTGRIETSTGTLVAPLSSSECVAYVAVARSFPLRGAGPGGRTAPPSVDLCEMKIAPLVIAVQDGTVTIEGDCNVSLRPRPVSPRDVQREAEFLARRQLKHFLRSTEFTEAVLRVGDRVWVSGVLVYESGGEHGYRDRPVRMRLEHRPGRPLSIGRARRGVQRGSTGRRRLDPL